jgi:hypothetical protein
MIAAFERARVLRETGCCQLDWLNQRFRREWLRQIGDTSGLQRGQARRIVVITGDEYYGQQDTSRLELVSQIDAGPVAQIDIENDAASIVEIAVILQGLRGVEQNGLEAMFPQEPFHASQHGRIVIDDKNGSSIWQVRPLISVGTHFNQQLKGTAKTRKQK